MKKNHYQLNEVGPRNLCLWASDSICFILSFEKKTKTTKYSHPDPHLPTQKNPKQAGEGKPAFLWSGLKALRWSREQVMRITWPHLQMHAFSLPSLSFRCKMPANRPVLFTKLISVWRKPWFCAPARLERTAAAPRGAEWQDLWAVTIIRQVQEQPSIPNSWSTSQN